MTSTTRESVDLGELPIQEFLDTAAIGFRVLATVLDAAGLVGSDVAKAWLSRYELMAARAKKLENFVDMVARMGTYNGTSPFLRDEARKLIADRERTTWSG